MPADPTESLHSDSSLMGINLVYELPAAWLSAMDVGAWVQRQQLPEGMRRRGLESLAHSLLTVLWWHLIEDLREGIRVSNHESGRLIRLGRVFRYYVHDESGDISSCQMDPSCGARWYVMDVLRPVSLRFWVARVLHQQFRLERNLEETLVEFGWKHYPDRDREYDFDAASQITISVWEWAVEVIHRRVRHGGLGTVLNRHVRELIIANPELLRIALCARPADVGTQRLPDHFWNQVARNRKYFLPLARYLPSAVSALGALMNNRPEEEWVPIAQMLVRAANQSAQPPGAC